MRATIRIGKGLDSYIKQMEELAGATQGMMKATIYPGAKVIADELRDAIQALPELERQPRETGSTKTQRKDNRKNRQREPGKKPKGVTKLEKEGMLEGLGITRMRYDGSLLNAKIGMDGYNNHVTEKWPQGHPNAMIARATEYGTSFRQKTPFIQPTAKYNKRRAERHMKAEFERQFEKHWNPTGGTS